MATKTKTPKTSFTEQIDLMADGPVYVTGSTVWELMNELERLPEDMTISLETQPHSAIGIAFDRVVTAKNQRGESEQIALFQIVNQEWFDKSNARAAAGKYPKLDSIRRTAHDGEPTAADK